MKHILLIDDEEVFNFIHAQVIQSVAPGTRITEQCSGRDALELLKSSSADEMPDVVFVDINMPDLSGFDFLLGMQQALTELSKRPDVYMVTSSLFESDRTKASTYPILTGFLEKPVSADQIQIMLAKTRGN